MSIHLVDYYTYKYGHSIGGCFTVWVLSTPLIIELLHTQTDGGKQNYDFQCHISNPFWVTQQLMKCIT